MKKNEWTQDFGVLKACFSNLKIPGITFFNKMVNQMYTQQLRNVI